MTNYIKKLMASVLLAGSVFVTPVLAEDVCERGKLAEVVATVVGTAGDRVPTELSEKDRKTLFDKKGPPPNADDSPIDIIRIDADGAGMSMLLFGQHGCLINKIGPVPTIMLDAILDTSHA